MTRRCYHASRLGCQHDLAVTFVIQRYHLIPCLNNGGHPNGLTGIFVAFVCSVGPDGGNAGAHAPPIGSFSKNFETRHPLGYIIFSFRCQHKCVGSIHTRLAPPYWVRACQWHTNCVVLRLRDPVWWPLLWKPEGRMRCQNNRAAVDMMFRYSVVKSVNPLNHQSE